MGFHQPGVLCIVLPPLDHLTFVHEAPDGSLRAWDVTEGCQIAQDGRLPIRFYLADHAVTLDWIEYHYPNIDWDYARTANLSHPLLAIPLAQDIMLIIDGWHRLALAVLEGWEELPILLLTQEEADAIQWLELPPGQAL